MLEMAREAKIPQHKMQEAIESGLLSAFFRLLATDDSVFNKEDPWWIESFNLEPEVEINSRAFDEAISALDASRS